MFTVTDALGRTVQTHQVTEARDRFNLESLPQGILLYSFKTGGKVYTGKIVVVK